jgi:hypothetical protein
MPFLMWKKKLITGKDNLSQKVTKPIVIEVTEKDSKHD